MAKRILEPGRERQEKSGSRASKKKKNMHRLRGLFIGLLAFLKMMIQYKGDGKFSLWSQSFQAPNAAPVFPLSWARY